MTVEVIFISIATSIIASLIWWLLSAAPFALFGGKKKIEYLITISLDCARQFEYSIEYDDYDNACRQADRLIDLIMSIDGAIKPLTYLPKKAKLVRTYIYSAFRIIDIFENLNIGYKGTQEKEARCQKFKQIFLNSIMLEEGYAVSHLSFTYEVLQELNLKKSVKKALLGIPAYALYDIQKKREFLIDKLVYINAFKSERRNDDFIKNFVFTRNSYQKYISKKLKN